MVFTPKTKNTKQLQRLQVVRCNQMYVLDGYCISETENVVVFCAIP